MTGPFTVPPSTWRALQEAPADGATVLLLRHSVRGPIPAREDGNDVLLLPEGKALARELGLAFGGRLRTLHASPVRRCVETAESLAEGAGAVLPIIEDTHLGHPGVYVADGEAAWTTWSTLGHERVMSHLVAGDRLAGLADPREASRRLVEHMLRAAGGAPGFHVFVTHDSLVTTAAAHCLGLPLGRPEWPVYLEALTLVTAGSGPVRARYRDWEGELRWG